MSKPGTAKTFQNYADLVFVPYVKSYIATRHQAEAKEGRAKTVYSSNNNAEGLERLSPC